MTEPLEVTGYRLAIEAYAERWLRPYLERHCDDVSQTGTSKEFNDPIWGTVLVDSHEVFIVDSPLIQRLRRIRQLGVAHLVYPAGGHTRFEHSLGVMHQVQRLVESINLHTEDPAARISDDHVRLLRLAALCHDVGHGLMSHVVENALRLDSECKSLVTAIKAHLGRDTEPQLSEAAAYYLVGSPAFSELAQLACRVGGVPIDEGMPSKMQKLIIGQQLDNKTPLLHELITGPFDADKLDYMPRDARMCGVPVVTDVVRLVQKVRAVEVSSHDLPDGLSSLVPGGTTCVITGIARSGASTLDELALGRSLMFDKIYRHHKVRAAEAMVGVAVAQLRDLIPTPSPLIPFMLIDDELLNLDLARLEALVTQECASPAAGTTHPVGVPQQPSSDSLIVADICERLRDRRLFVRAFAFSQKMPGDPYHGDAAHRLSMSNFINATSNAEDRARFVQDVGDAATEIMGLVGASGILGQFPNGEIAPYIWVDPPAERPTDNKPETGRAYLIDDDGRLERTEKSNAETRGWAEAYVLTRDIGYVFCPREIATYVHLAAEVIARVNFDVRLPDSMATYAKRDRTKTRALRLELAAANFYDGALRHLAPMPDDALLASRDQSLAALTSRLQGYAGPAEQGAVERPKLGPARFREWARQFGTEHAAAALDIAEAVHLIGRDDVSATLRAFIAAHPEFRGGSLCPLGEPKDGSSILTYFSGDAGAPYDLKIRGLSDALAHGGSIIFIDDLVGLGRSTVSIFEALFGLPQTTSLDEERGEALAEDAARALRGASVAVVYCAGLHQGETAVRVRLARPDMAFESPPTVFVHVAESALPTVSKVLDGLSSEKRTEFLEECRRIGDALLDDENPAHDSAWRAERALGYGNLELLVISAYNTPTATLAPLWRDGYVDGIAWRSLFPRRKKT